MPFEETITRTPVIQQISSFALAVNTAAVALSAVSQPEALIDSILINVPVGEAQAVFLGDSTVTAASGVEIQPGVIFNLALSNQRQMYELQRPLVSIARAVECEHVPLVSIPFIVWDPAQVFLIAAALTDVRIMLFRSVYI